VIIHKALITVGLGVYLLGVGTLAGMAIERVRFNRERTAVLAPYERALHEWQAYRIGLEKSVGAMTVESEAKEQP
jgi:hypothetical protein